MCLPLIFSSSFLPVSIGAEEFSSCFSILEHLVAM